MTFTVNQAFTRFPDSISIVSNSDIAEDYIKSEILAKYSEEGGKMNREIILKHHKVEDVCNQLLSL